jgi:hypothetical protein
MAPIAYGVVRACLAAIRVDYLDFADRRPNFVFGYRAIR